LTFRNHTFALLSALALTTVHTAFCALSPSQAHINELKQMFQQFTVKKNIAVMPKFYDKAFVFEGNNITYNYQQFKQLHARLFKTPIRYTVSFNADSWVADNTKVAVLGNITTTMPNKKPKQLSVMLIAKFHNKKIRKIWETTFPDWSYLRKKAHKLSK
jgi:hypothetical protein